MLRRSLLSRWAAGGGIDDLVDRLQQLDINDPDGARGAEARLSVWFSVTEPGNGRLVGGADPVLTGLSAELRARLTSTPRSVTGMAS